MLGGNIYGHIRQGVAKYRGSLRQSRLYLSSIIYHTDQYCIHQAAKTKQRIKEEQMQIKVEERSKQIELQEQEIVRRERELEATVRKPADAERYRLEKLAEANRSVESDYI